MRIWGGLVQEGQDMDMEMDMDMDVDVADILLLTLLLLLLLHVSIILCPTIIRSRRIIPRTSRSRLSIGKTGVGEGTEGFIRSRLLRIRGGFWWRLMRRRRHL
jgi:hypothetical protein